MAATTVEGKIVELLLARLAALSLTPALPVAWPDVKFTPPAGAYLEARHLPNTTQNLHIAAADPSRHLGIFQVTVAAPDGLGIVAISDVAGQIAAHFAKGTRMFNGALRVEVYEAPSVAPILQDGGRVRLPVSIRWQAFA